MWMRWTVSTVKRIPAPIRITGRPVCSCLHATPYFIVIHTIPKSTFRHFATRHSEDCCGVLKCVRHILPKISSIVCKRWFFLRRLWSMHGICNTLRGCNSTVERTNVASSCRKQRGMKNMPAHWLICVCSWFLICTVLFIHIIKKVYLLSVRYWWIIPKMNVCALSVTSIWWETDWWLPLYTRTRKRERSTSPKEHGTTSIPMRNMKATVNMRLRRN